MRVQTCQAAQAHTGGDQRLSLQACLDRRLQMVVTHVWRIADQEVVSCGSPYRRRCGREVLKSQPQRRTLP